jgi:hypothetical protein
VKNRVRLLAGLLMAGALSAVADCGGGGSSSSSGNGNGNGGAPPVANTAPITAGPGPSTVNPFVDGAFVSVTVCVPGSSSQCVTIPDVLLDTGSSGLRVLSSTLNNLPLTNVTSNGATLANCTQFVDLTSAWGPVALADVRMAGEVARSIPIEIIAEPSLGFPDAPSSCSNGGVVMNSVDTLSANGILGVSSYIEDCGGACAPGTRANGGVYYACAGASCQVTTAALSSQVQNPVAAFASDNNGVTVTLPALPELGAPSAAGTLTFGIGTQGDNALGSAVVQTADGRGNITTQFNGVAYSSSFIDSGSNGLFFLDSKTTGIPDCSASQGYYCPPTTQNLSATTRGANGQSKAVSFRVANADNLPLANWVFDDLAGSSSFGGTTNGPASLYFDWGLPFFFGRTVYVAIEGRTTPGGAGPYWAY